jgi:hypothetical protein
MPSTCFPVAVGYLFRAFHGDEPNTGNDKEETHAMELLLYVPVSQDVRERVVDILERVVPGDRMRVCSTIGNLYKNLKMSQQHLTIAVLVLSNRRELMKLRSIRPMFRDMRILLVLPDTEEETIAMAHRFQPRYLTFVDKNIPALATVVDRMRKSTYRKDVLGDGQ